MFHEMSIGHLNIRKQACQHLCVLQKQLLTRYFHIYEQQKRYKLCTLWRERRMFGLNWFAVRALLSRECRVHNVKIELSTIAHSRPIIACFETQALVDRKVIAFYNGSLVHKMMPDALDPQIFYGEVVMVTIRKWFHTPYALLTKTSFLLEWKIPFTMASSSLIFFFCSWTTPRSLPDEALCCNGSRKRCKV